MSLPDSDLTLSQRLLNYLQSGGLAGVTHWLLVLGLVVAFVVILWDVVSNGKASRVAMLCGLFLGALASIMALLELNRVDNQAATADKPQKKER